MKWYTKEPLRYDLTRIFDSLYYAYNQLTNGDKCDNKSQKYYLLDIHLEKGMKII